MIYDLHCICISGPVFIIHGEDDQEVRLNHGQGIIIFTVTVTYVSLLLLRMYLFFADGLSVIAIYCDE